MSKIDLELLSDEELQGLKRQCSELLDKREKTLPDELLDELTDEYDNIINSTSIELQVTVTVPVSIRIWASRQENEVDFDNLDYHFPYDLLNAELYKTKELKDAKEDLKKLLETFKNKVDNLCEEHGANSDKVWYELDMRV